MRRSGVRLGNAFGWILGIRLVWECIGYIGVELFLLQIPRRIKTAPMNGFDKAILYAVALNIDNCRSIGHANGRL
jgi:hypothetical protein